MAALAFSELGEAEGFCEEELPDGLVLGEEKPFDVGLELVDDGLLEPPENSDFLLGDEKPFDGLLLEPPENSDFLLLDPGDEKPDDGLLEPPENSGFLLDDGLLEPPENSDFLLLDPGDEKLDGGLLFDFGDENPEVGLLDEPIEGGLLEEPDDLLDELLDGLLDELLDGLANPSPIKHSVSDAHKTTFRYVLMRNSFSILSAFS